MSELGSIKDELSDLVDDDDDSSYEKSPPKR